MAAGLALALNEFSASDRRLVTIADGSIASMSKPFHRAQYQQVSGLRAADIGRIRCLAMMAIFGASLFARVKTSSQPVQAM